MRFLAVLLLSLTLSACGFTLRGAALPESLKQMNLQAGDMNSLLIEKLEQELRYAGVQLLPDEMSATALVSIVTDTAGERVLSVSARGEPQEYELYHTVEFVLILSSGKTFTPVSMTLTRDYFFDQQDILSKSEDAEFLRDALAEDVARAIVRRAALLVRSQ